MASHTLSPYACQAFWQAALASTSVLIVLGQHLLSLSLSLFAVVGRSMQLPTKSGVCWASTVKGDLKANHALSAPEPEGEIAPVCQLEQCSANDVHTEAFLCRQQALGGRPAAWH